MNIIIIAKHFTASENLKEFINEKVLKINKYNNDIIKSIEKLIVQIKKDNQKLIGK